MLLQDKKVIITGAGGGWVVQSQKCLPSRALCWRLRMYRLICSKEMQVSFEERGILTKPFL